MPKQTTKVYFFSGEVFDVFRAARAAKRRGLGHIKLRYYNRYSRRGQAILILTTSSSRHEKVQKIGEKRGVGVMTFDALYSASRQEKGRWYRGGSVCYCCGVIQTTDFRPRWEEVLCKECEKLSPLHLLLHVGLEAMGQENTD